MKGMRREPSTAFLYGWLLFTIFVEYARPSNQFPFLGLIPYFYSAPAYLLFVITMFGGGMRPAKDIFSDGFAKWILIFFGVVLLSYAVTGFTSSASVVFLRVLGYTAVFFMITRLATTEARVIGIILTLMFAHVYILVFNFNVLTNPSLRQYLMNSAPFLGDGNDFALSIGLLFPAIVAVALLARGKLTKLFAWSAAAVIPLALVATQSRGATLGFGAVLAFLWWRSSRKGLSTIAVALVGCAVLLYAPQQYYTRMSSISSAAETDTSAQGRLNAWSGSIGMGLKNPLGIGAGNFGVRWGKTAHSTYFLALGELGLPGFVCMVVLILGNIRANNKLRKELLAQVGSSPPEDARRSLLLLDMLNASMVYFAVTGAFLSATYYPHIFVLAGLLIVVREFARRRCQVGTEAPAAVRATRPGAVTQATRIAHG